MEIPAIQTQTGEVTLTENGFAVKFFSPSGQVFAVKLRLQFKNAAMGVGRRPPFFSDTGRRPLTRPCPWTELKRPEGTEHGSLKG